MKKFFLNKVVVVTGSSAGIGKKTALELCKNGAQVIINGRNENKLQLVQKEFLHQGYSVSYCVADTTNYHDCCWLTNYAIQNFGQIDFVIANASISMNGRFEDTKPYYFKSVVDSNVYGVAMPLFSFLPFLKKTNGSFVIISSIAGLFGLPTASAYCTGKMALSAFHQSVSSELSVYNVHVGIVYVGFTINDADKKTLSPSGEEINVPKRNKFIQQSQEKVSLAILKTIKNKSKIKVLSAIGKLLFFVVRFFPSLLLHFAKRSEKIAFQNSL